MMLTELIYQIIKNVNVIFNNLYNGKSLNQLFKICLSGLFGAFFQIPYSRDPINSFRPERPTNVLTMHENLSNESENMAHARKVDPDEIFDTQAAIATKIQDNVSLQNGSNMYALPVAKAVLASAPPLCEAVPVASSQDDVVPTAPPLKV